MDESSTRVVVGVLNDDWCLRSTATAKLPNEVTPAKILRHACHCCRRLVEAFDAMLLSSLSLLSSSCHCCRRLVIVVVVFVRSVHVSVVFIDRDHCCFDAMLCALIIVVSVLHVSVVIIEHEVAIAVRVRVAIFA